MSRVRRQGWSALTRRLAGEAGATLIEIVMSSFVLATMSVGVMTGFDVVATTSGNTKQKAAAANVAEHEIERMRSMRISELVALPGTPETVTENGVTFTRTATAEWVAQPYTGSICDVTGPPTYLRLSVAVSWPGRKGDPVSVTSLLAPGARGTLSEQGALVIRIVDVTGDGVAGVPVSLGGGAPQGTTDSDGCVSWSPLAADTYSMSFTKSGYFAANGQTTVTDSISVAGQAVAEREYTYSQAATVSGSFYSVRGGVNVPSFPTKVAIASPGRATLFANVSGGAFSVMVPPDATNPSTIFAGGCDAARPPVAYQTDVTLGPGANVSGLEVPMPALDAVTRIKNSNKDGNVEVYDVCGERYFRPTFASLGGKLADPGFPYSASNIDVCGEVYYSGSGPSKRWYRKRVTRTNPFPSSSYTFNFDYDSTNVYGWCWRWKVCSVDYDLDSGWNGGNC